MIDFQENRPQYKLLFVMLSIALYILIVQAFYPLISRSTLAFAILPVFVSGILFGLKGGGLIGITMFFLTPVLFLWAGEPELKAFIGRNFWSSHIAVLVFGILVGYTNDLKERLKLELKEREKTEKEKEQLIIDLQDALDNLVTLEGMIPICANCKKIRDDKGLWNQIEQYVETHTNAVFSHGVCPECEKELFGSEEWYKKKMLKRST